MKRFVGGMILACVIASIAPGFSFAATATAQPGAGAGQSDSAAPLFAAEIARSETFVADMMRDPHFQARGLFHQVEIDGKPLKLPALAPRLSATPGGTEWPGPAVGSHNDEIFGAFLGLSEAERQTLSQEGII